MNEDNLFALFDGVDADPLFGEIDAGPLYDDAATDLWMENGDVAIQQSVEDVLHEGIADLDVSIIGDGNNNVLQDADGVVITGEPDSIFDPIFRIIDDILYGIDGQTDIVSEHHFTDNGNFDVKNNVIVEGNVADDIKYVDQQTHGSCSLMAQEQFVERYTGQPIPEDYLEWRAEKWGVYDPDIGTEFSGQTMVLDHFNIPYERHYLCDLEDLDDALQSDNDAIIGVDARVFYDDPGIPPGSGHAVAVVGRGVDPVTHEVKGYYVTDSNFADAAHFVDAERLENAWTGLSDMIVIPNKNLA